MRAVKENYQNEWNHIHFADCNMEENIGNYPQTKLRWCGYKSRDYHKFEQKRTRGDPFAHKLEQSGGGGGASLIHTQSHKRRLLVAVEGLSFSHATKQFDNR